MTETYLAQSPVTDPGAYASWVAELPSDVSALRDASSQLVFHYRGGGDYAQNGVPDGRVREIDTRYVDEMLKILHGRSGAPLGTPRPASERLVGCCRDFTALFVSFARAHGVPARTRVGFAGYFMPGWWLDHVVGEIWDAEQNRWRASRNGTLDHERFVGLLTGPISETDKGLLDELAGEISDTVDPELVGSWLRNEPLRIPEELTSYSPTSGPQQVTLRPGLAT